jgi:signal peptidase I
MKFLPLYSIIPYNGRESNRISGKMKFIFNRSYSLFKSKTVLRHSYRLFNRRKRELTKEAQEDFQAQLLSLHQATEARDRKEASEQAKKIEIALKKYFKKSRLRKAIDTTLALGVALFIAIVVRQTWFELYEIPTGSMRPTLKEKDRLVVSKTDFGINFPLSPRHFYFNPELVKRSGIVVFTGENLDMHDVDTRYFFILPGKKQLVKRMIGKPGDSLYFYGGLIYGVDKDGRDISPELQQESLSYLEHIPFIYPSGKVTTPKTPIHGIYPSAILHQMNEPIARLQFNELNQMRGEMLTLKATHFPGFPQVSDYYDLWGFKNFATARLLTKTQVEELTYFDTATAPETKLYLELKHHPSLQSLKLTHDEMGRLRPSLSMSTSIIPLQEKHFQALFDNLYTARFIVKDGKAMRYGFNPKYASANRFLPDLPGVPNGMYEFYNGKAYAIKWQGIASELPDSHPLYERTPSRLQLLFNLGIEFDTRFSPQGKSQPISPSRYAYFRNDELYLLGAPIFKNDDPALDDFILKEYEKQSVSSSLNPYYPFHDQGPPLRSDGSVDVDFIRHYGLTVPPKMYLVLGDNHAMSADSRDFGFVPEENLRGSPDFVFWPPGNRFGPPVQPSFPLINFPRVFTWFFFTTAVAVWYAIQTKKNKQLPPLK